jgi:hypothetical protein
VLYFSEKFNSNYSNSPLTTIGSPLIASTFPFLNSSFLSFSKVFLLAIGVLHLAFGFYSEQTANSQGLTTQKIYGFASLGPINGSDEDFHVLL